MSLIIISKIKSNKFFAPTVFLLALAMALSASAKTASAKFSQFYNQDPRNLTAAITAAAQDAESEINIEEKINLDEDFQPEDFDLEGVGMLPTNPFYFLKDARRGIASFFTFDPVKQTERRMQYASEKLLETKTLAEDEDSSDEDIQGSLDNFREEMETVKERIENAVTETGEEDSAILGKKMMDSFIKYEKTFGGIEKNLSPEAYDNITETRDKAAEVFGSVFELMDPEVASEKLVEVLEEQKGSEFKDFKNIEVLKGVEDMIPEQAKVAVRYAQENALNRLQSELEKFEATKRAIFEDFVKEIGGNEVRHLEIINELETRPLSEDLRQAIIKAKEEALSKTERKLETFTTEEQKDSYLDYLSEGSLSDIRTISELEGSLGEGVLSGIQRVKIKAEDKFRTKVAEIDQGGEGREEFFKDIERFHDIKSIGVLGEIEALIPEDKRGFFEELKEKIANEIKEDIERARDESQQKIIFDSLAGDRPEYFNEISKFESTTRAPFSLEESILDGIREAQFRKMQERAEVITDQERFQRYEDEFRKQEDYFRQEYKQPENFFNVFDDRRYIFESSTRADDRIDEAERVIEKLRTIIAELPVDTTSAVGQTDYAIEEANRSLAVAERKLQNAYSAISIDDVGRAFGEADAAINIALGGIDLANDYRYGRKVEQEIRCPFFFPPPSDFCRGGEVIYETDQYGCALPPRCEFKRCPDIRPEQCPEGSYQEKVTDSQGCPGYSRCIKFEDKPSQGQCPLPPTERCPEGEIHEQFTNENGCIIYEGCKPMTRTTPWPDPIEPPETCMAIWYGYVYEPGANYCRAESTSGCNDPYIYHDKDSCERENGLMRPQWIEHIWQFQDGQTENSMILDRADDAYLQFVTGIEEQCRQITQNQFIWKPNAGNDADWNWQNFGIPDCTGTAPTTYCGNNVCESNETQASCPNDCGYTGPIAETGDNSCDATLEALLPGCHTMPGSPNVRFNTDMDRYVEVGTTEIKYCSAGSIPGCMDYYSAVGPYPPSTTPDSGVCPGGYHWHDDSGGYCISDSEDYSGTCYDGSGTNVITCPANTWGSVPGTSSTSDSCPSGYHWHDDSGGYCIDDQENYSGTCYDSSGTNVITCPEYDYPSVSPMWCGNNVCDSGEDQNSCPSDCGTSTTPPTTTTTPPASVDQPCGEYNTCSTGNYCADPANSWCCPNDQVICNDGQCVNSLSECPTTTPVQQSCSNTGYNYPYSADCNYSACPQGCDYDASGCPNACAFQVNVCGNGECESAAGETTLTCSADCGEPTGWCGDGICNNTETASWCGIDCAPTTTSTGTGSTGTTGTMGSSAATSGSGGTASGITDSSCDAALEALLPGCHTMSESPNVRFNGAMDQYVEVGTTQVQYCDTASIPGCAGTYSSDSGTSYTSGSGACPSGYHWHDDSGGYCIDDNENYSGTCYDSSGTTMITCPASDYDSGASYSGWCGDNVCDSGETASSCSSDCGGGDGGDYYPPPYDDGGGDYYPPPGGSSCPDNSFNDPGTMVCNTATCPNGCNFDTQGCPTACW
jgi:hypothetical protein